MKTLFRLLSLLEPFAGEILLSILLGVATVASGIGLLGTSAYLIASAALHPSIADLQLAIVGVRFFGISRGVFRYLERLVSHSVNLRIVSFLRANYYSRIEPGAPANLYAFRSGDILGKVIGDLEILENFYVRVISPVIVAIIISILVSIFVGGYLVEIGLILFSGLVINGFILPGLTVIVSKPQVENLTRVKAELSSVIVETIQGLEDLQACGAQEHWFERISNENAKSGKLQNTLTFFNSLNSGLVLLFMNLTVLGIIWVFIPEVNSDRLSGISMAVVMLLAMASFEVTLALPSAAQNLNSSIASGKRVYDIGEAGSDVVQDFQNVTFPVGKNLEFEGVHFAYGEGQQVLLEEINLKLTKGEKIAIVGASGEGKTSLLNLILRFQQPLAGKISIDGVDISTLESDEVRRNFGVIMQSPYLFNSTLRENLLLVGKVASDDDLHHALEEVELKEWSATLPEGLDTWVGEHGMKLSAGEKQRISIARLLLQDKPFVLLDEPTANLDPVNARLIMARLWEHFSQSGVLIITHRLGMLGEMDEILVLENAKIIERGNFSDLILLNGKFKAMYDLELDWLEPLLI